MARTGCTACSTIHSPTEETFALFDDLLLLVFGRAVYFGPVPGVLTHFTGLGFQYEPDYSLAEARSAARETFEKKISVSFLNHSKQS